MDRRTDQHVHSVEERIHREHAQRREQARAGDGTIEAGEAELARIRAAKYRRDNDALRAENEDLRRQLAELRRQLAEVTR